MTVETRAQTNLTERLARAAVAAASSCGARSAMAATTARASDSVRSARVSTVMLSPSPPVAKSRS